MAREKSEQPEQQDVEPDREVDPPEATSDDTDDPERRRPRQWVQIGEKATL